jgi:hypothetical protein
MYILTDDVFNKLMGGEFVQVIEAMKVQPNAPVRKLYNLQFDYFSYEGFRKFYNKVMSKIINGVVYYDDNNIIGHSLKEMVEYSNEKKQ